MTCPTCGAATRAACEYPDADAVGCLKALPDYGRLVLTRASDVRSQAVVFLVPGLVPLKTFTLLAGIGGLGKSMLTAFIAASETRGDYDAGTPHDVVVISYEDTLEEIWRPRLLAAGGDPDRLIYLTVEMDEGGVVQLPQDLEFIERVIRDHGVRLVIVDPLVASIDRSYDAHKDQHVRGVIGRLASVAKTTGSAWIGIGHLNKNDGTEAFLRVANSMAFWNSARSVVLVTKEDDDHRLVSQVKANWARVRAVQRWAIESVVLPDEIAPDTGKPIETSRMVYFGEAEEVDIDDVLRRPAEDQGEKFAIAASYLLTALAGGEWHESSAAKENRPEGVSERTLQRAVEQLGIEHERSSGFPSTTVWRLPVAPSLTSPPGGATVNTSPVKGLKAVERPVAPSAGGSKGHGATGRDAPESSRTPIGSPAHLLLADDDPVADELNYYRRTLADSAGVSKKAPDVVTPEDDPEVWGEILARGGLDEPR